MTPDVDKITLFAKGSVKKWLMPGGGKILTDDTLSALVDNNPSRMLYGHVWCSPLDAADVAAVKMVLKIEQLVVFYDRKTPAASTQ